MGFRVIIMRAAVVLALLAFPAWAAAPAYGTAFEPPELGPPYRKPPDAPQQTQTRANPCWRFDSAELAPGVVANWNDIAAEKYRKKGGDQFDLFQVSASPRSFMRGNARNSACYLADNGKVRCERGPDDYVYNQHKVARAHAMVIPIVAPEAGEANAGCNFGRGIYWPLEQRFRFGYEMCVPSDARSWLARTNWVLISQVQSRGNPNAALHIAGDPRGSYFYACVRGDRDDVDRRGRDFEYCVKPIGPPVEPGRCYTIEQEYLGSQRGGYRVWINGAMAFDTWERFRGPVQSVYGQRRPHLSIGMYTYDEVFERMKGTLYFDKMWIEPAGSEGS
ncbi:MAG: hypothetical protein IPM60_08245 [Rhodospirillales bacterium]|nr:hypothetical protein [Rhodospirillales bacterium]